MTYTQHPLSAAFPSMSTEDQQALAADIDKNGQREPITIFEGMVLDGWHRYGACQSLGIEVDERVLPADEDPVAFVKSRNLHRRHLTGSQRAAAIVACSEWHPAHRAKKGEPGSPFSNTDMAREADVSTRTIQHAKAAHAAGLSADVRDGKVSAKQAAEMAKPGRHRGKPKKGPKADAIREELNDARARRKGVDKQAAAEAYREAPAADPDVDDDQGELDPYADLQKANDEIVVLTNLIEAMKVDDKAAKVLNLSQQLHVAERIARDKDTAAVTQRRRADHAEGLLKRIGKRVGELDIDKIPAAVAAALKAKAAA